MQYFASVSCTKVLMYTHTIAGRTLCSRWDTDRHAAGAGGRAKAGWQATYLLIRLRRKSPCIYFELACVRV